jgi:hypothetical protein
MTRRAATACDAVPESLSFALFSTGDQEQAGLGEHALVWRQGFKPRVRSSSAAEYALVLALLAGLSLEQALTMTHPHLISRLGWSGPCKQVWSQARTWYPPLRKNIHEYP